LQPTAECALGTLSPELTDQDSNRNEPVFQPPEGDMVCIQCHLDPDLFQNPIPDEQGGHSTWTMKQRDKAQYCPTLQTVDELSVWVSDWKRLSGGLFVHLQTVEWPPPFRETSELGV
jgi:hypothetical protein